VGDSSEGGRWQASFMERWILMLVLVPHDYLNWCTDSVERAEDDAYMFGHYLVLHCRRSTVRGR
jgi:hypothetical protein